MAKNDFSDLSPQDAVGLVANTAIVARDSGHEVEVANASRGGVAGIFVWLPGWRMVDGRIVATDVEQAATSGKQASREVAT